MIARSCEQGREHREEQAHMLYKIIHESISSGNAITLGI